MDKKHDDTLNNVPINDLNVVGDSPDEVINDDKLDGIWQNYEDKDLSKPVIINENIEETTEFNEVEISLLDEDKKDIIDLEVSKEISPDLNTKQDIKRDDIKLNEKRIKSKKSKKTEDQKSNKLIWIYILLATVILVLIGLMAVSILSKDRIIDKIIFNFNNVIKVKDKEYASYNLDLKASGNTKYNILNNVKINGIYASENNTFKTNTTININEDVINLDYYSDKDTYFYDEYISASLLKLNNNYDFSINSLNKNVLSFIKQLNNINITKYIDNKLNGLNSKLTLELTQTNLNSIVDELRTIKLDNLYQNILNNLIENMTNNPNNYIGTKIVLNTNVWGSLVKLEISNKHNIIITNKDNTINIEIIDENNKVINIKYNKDNLLITENIGSRNSLTINMNINIEYLKENKVNVKEVKDIIDIENISEQDEYNIKKNLTSNKNRNALMELYYYLNSELNTLNMYVTLDNYYIYYNVPNNYNISNYTGDSYKKYIHIDSTITYGLKKYNNRQVLDYITSLYEKEASSPFYYNVIKKESMSINFKNIDFNYQIVTKTYDSNYSDFDNTSSTIYIWYQLDTNYAFIIEYEFQGSEIKNEEITSLLDLQVGR